MVRIISTIMKKVFYILICVLTIGTNTIAQEVKTLKTDSVRNSIKPQTEIRASGDVNAIALCPDESVLEQRPATGFQQTDSLHLPVLNSFGQVPLSMYPLGWSGFYDWDLHEGLNVNLGASVFGAFGKNAPHGAGFSQNISAMYAVPLSGKLSLAVGGYFNNIQWNNRSFRDGGLNAVLGYKFDEHWEAYLYGQKSIMNKRMPPLLYDMNSLGDRIGAAVKYNFNPRFSVTVSVEERKY